ncbi:MAG: hypothetical protein UZ21_OP11001000733 [Microgenomates bacterium OLB22]|nr:MAG: hypothetical protein UZ21_OP11001000733 [Microgenomates bacterium OLB22]
MRDYTALVLEVLDSDVIGVSKVDISPGQKPVLQGVIVAARDEINDARVVSKLVRGRLPEHFVKDVITWRPDAEEKD